MTEELDTAVAADSAVEVQEQIITPPWVADLSWAWPTLDGATLRNLGAEGVIAYAGCNDASKNVGKTRFDDWRAHGLWVGLVCEDSATYLQGGFQAGVAQAQRLVTAASSLGYDYHNCVLFLSADWNVQSQADLGAVYAACSGAKAHIPHLGLYSNSYALDHCAQLLSVGWQSDSTSFSNGLSAHANLQQIYNDPRAQGKSLDVNNIIRLPLLMEGEPVTQPAPKDTVTTTDPTWNAIIDHNGVKMTAAQRLVDIEVNIDQIMKKLGI